MHLSELEVVWPLHRSHYLSPALADAGIDMNTEPESSEAPPLRRSATRRPVPSGASVTAATAGRELAARALLAGGCLQTRVAELLHTSRRSVGRMVEADVTAALRDADVVDQARTCLADTAIRGSTAEEREAADAWLVHALRDERHVERFHQRTVASRRPVSQTQRRQQLGEATGGDTGDARRRTARSAAGGVRARATRRPHAPATAHRASQRAPRLRDRGREP